MKPMMKCGCAAQGTCSSMGGVEYNPPIPSCVVHSCIEVAETQIPNDRMAKCDCGKISPSSPNLPFFEFKGEGSPSSKERCKHCGYFESAHWPSWMAHIRVVRRWFKIERYDEVMKRHFNAPEDLKELIAEHEADFFRSQMSATHSPETRVHSVEVVQITPERNTHQCKTFEPHGPYEFDSYYCGCRGWD